LIVFRIAELPDCRTAESSVAAGRGHSIRRSHSAAVRQSRRERGYMLLAILLMLALLMIAMVAVAPQIATQIRRDREEELIHRGNEYRKAIRRYFRKFGRYPAKIEDLENTNNMRFLRKRYKDPITGQDFRIIHYGEQKTQSHGFFGQPLTAGTQPGAIGSPLNSPNPNNPQSPLGGNPPNPNAPNAPAPTGPNTAGSALGQTTFGGGAIIGVSSTSPKRSLHVINGKDHYNEWEFIYDPTQEVMVPGGGAGGVVPGMLGGTPGGMTTNPPGGIMTPNPPQPPPQQPPQPQFPQ
jgi:type II secretory pathway pseudopilin PulG